MPHPNQITQAHLMRLPGTPESPQLLDVRLAEDIARDPRIIPTSRLIPHDHELSTSTARTEVICARGRKLSEAVAALRRTTGIPTEVLEGGAEIWAEAGLPIVPLANLPPGNLWVTRHRPKINCTACLWLIRRFIAPYSGFLCVAPAEVPAVAERFNATTFDSEDTLYSDRGDHSGFDTVPDLCGLQTEAPQRLARVIRARGTDRHDLSPQAAGLLTISVGLSRQFRDDLEQRATGMILYDAPYRWARDGHDESHDWPAGRTQ